MDGFEKAQQSMKRRCVPGGEPIIVKSGTAALAVKKALRSEGNLRMDLDGVSLDLNMDILGQDGGDEVQRATNYTSSKVGFIIIIILFYFYLYFI